MLACHERGDMDSRGSSVGNGCGRKVGEGISHQGWAGFQEANIDRGRSGHSRKREPCEQRYFENPGSLLRKWSNSIRLAYRTLTQVPSLARSKGKRLTVGETTAGAKGHDASKEIRAVDQTLVKPTFN